VRRRPYDLVAFENVEDAKDSAVCILNQILRTGYASDDDGTSTDFTKSVILIVLRGLSPSELRPCVCQKIIPNSPFKTYLDATSKSSGAKYRCQCVAMLKLKRG